MIVISKYLYNMELIYTLNTIETAALRLINLLSYSRILAFYGGMGSGKTTLIHHLCEVLGVKSNVSSPTYSIIHEYAGSDEKNIYHIDLYRIKDQQEAIDAGVEDCIYSGNFCFIEWPGILADLMPAKHVVIEIGFIDVNTRRLNYKFQT